VLNAQAATLHRMDGPSRFDGHPLGHLIGWSHLHAQSRISTFEHSMAHDRSGPDGLHTQAITDSAKSVYRSLRGAPTVQYTLHTKVQNWSAARLHCLSALFRRFAILSSGPSVGPFTPPLHRRHRTAMLSLRRARRIRSFFGPALRIRPFFCSPPSPFLCARAPHLPNSLPPSLPPSARHASRAVLTFGFFLHAFHVLPRSPPRSLPECLLISCSFLEASGGLRCRPPPACGGAPGAVFICFADHCFILRTIRQR